MENMELFSFYSLDECLNKKKVVKKLTSLSDEGKIEWSIDRDILKIKDLDLSEEEIVEVANLFDQNDIFPHHDIEDEDDYWGYDDFGDEDDESDDNW
jgi:hypothetical protein